MGGEQYRSAANRRSVRRRHVLFISGFDPQGPARYHAMFRDEGQRQAEVGAYRLSIGPRRRSGPHRSAWQVDFARAAGSRVQSPVEERARFATDAASSGYSMAPSMAPDPAQGPPPDGDADVQSTSTVEFLRWDDLVRAHWPKPGPRLAWLALRNLVRMMRNGVFTRAWRTTWPAAVALFLPGMLIAAWCVLAVSTATTLWAIWAGQLPRPWLLLPLAALGALALATIWSWRRAQMGWLTRSTHMVLAQARGRYTGLDDRIDEFAAHLRSLARDSTIDELMVVGHSSGCMLALSTVARAFPASENGERTAPEHLSLLTLGQCIPLLSFQPEAAGFRREIETAAVATAGRWVDITAPPDACCAALVDPTDVCTKGHVIPRPKLVSPRFATLFAPDRYAKLKQDRRKLHFQYLSASELRGEYDYFLTVCGPTELPMRYANARDISGYRRRLIHGNRASTA